MKNAWPLLELAAILAALASLIGVVAGGHIYRAEAVSWLVTTIVWVLISVGHRRGWRRRR